MSRMYTFTVVLCIVTVNHCIVYLPQVGGGTGGGGGGGEGVRGTTFHEGSRVVLRCYTRLKYKPDNVM